MKKRQEEAEKRKAEKEAAKERQAEEAKKKAKRKPWPKASIKIRHKPCPSDWTSRRSRKARWPIMSMTLTKTEP